MDAVFLQENEAAVLLFDLLDFTRLAAQSSPLDLNLLLSRYYAHCEAIIEKNGGRLVKFAGDAVLGAWLENETTQPRGRALASIAAARQGKAAFSARCRADGMGTMDYTVAAAAGPVLAGQIGTERHKAFDVLGETVNTAFKLAAAAQARGVDHLIAIPPQGGDLVEVEGIELAGRMVRLFRLGNSTS